MTHQETQERLGELLYIELSGQDPAEELPDVFAHLKSCFECYELYRALKTARQSRQGRMAGGRPLYTLEVEPQAGGGWRVTLRIRPDVLLAPGSEGDESMRSIRPIQSGGRLLLFTTFEIDGQDCQVMLVLNEQDSGFVIDADIMTGSLPYDLLAHLHLGGKDYASPVEEGQARFSIASLTTEDDLEFELRIQP